MHYYARPAFSVFALLLILAGSAFGQFVQQVEITVKPKRTDQLIAFGSTKGLNVATFQTLTFTVGPHTFVLPSSQFKNTKGTLKYTGKGRFAGISSFEINTKKQKFSLTTKNYPFSSLSNPLQISLATDGTTKCETLQLKQRASNSKPKSAKVIRGSATQVMVKKKSLGGCSLAGDIQLSPPVIKEGTSTTVEVSMRFPISPSPGSAKLFVRSPAGAPTGSALCTFADDGAEASADRVAGDGMYGCKAALTPSKLGTLDLIVQATIGGKTSYSPSLPVTVVKPLTDAIAEATAATHEAASSVFGQMVAKYGVTAGSNGSQGYSTIRLGNGDGTFEASVSYLTESSSSYALSLSDLNGDGVQDLVTAGRGSDLKGYATIRLGNGDGTFKAASSSQTGGYQSLALALSDLDRNGVVDLITGGHLTVGGGGGFTNICLGTTARVTTMPRLNLLSQKDARISLDFLKGQLNRISSELGAFGSFESRVSVASNVLQVSRENYLAANSRIEDADIASESASLVRNQILQQAASSVLAQTNQAPSLALMLLG